MKIFSAKQVREWDAYTLTHEPVSSSALMERAAICCYKWLIRHFDPKTSFVIFCGTGNNGGDGLAIARMLVQANYKTFIYILEGNSRSEDFSANLARLQPLTKSIKLIYNDNFPVFDGDEVIIDSLFGTGINRPLTELGASVVTQINNSKQPIVSIDIPSGLIPDEPTPGDVIVRANYTLTFQVLKLAFMLPQSGKYCGELHVQNINLHTDYYNSVTTPFNTIDPEKIKEIYKPRTSFTHKYDFGHALLFAGSKNMMGAAVLCAHACLRAGAGLATLKTEEGTQTVIQSTLPEAISSTEKDWKILAVKKSAIGFGPGLEQDTNNQQLLGDIIKNYEGALVVDASGLQLLAIDVEILQRENNSPVILTPHTGEFEKLFGKTTNDFERLNLCIGKAAVFNCIIVLKGHHTAVVSPTGETWFNMNGNAGMATAGSGDVLTGIITGLLAQNYAPFEACIFAVYLHGMAGDIAAEKMSPESMIAGDIINNLGEAFKCIAKSVSGKYL